MKLSVIIVNYNVKHFIEQCLFSVFKAAEHLACEVFVVDNNSVDGSVAHIRNKFPQVKLIANTENTGFSVANNQAIRLAKGEYILLLNPDTLVEEDTFSKVVSFMDKHPEAGALGVKMLDGKGNFLPESKRGLPTPMVAFYKIFGFSSLFPQSKKFGQYHLSYLDKDQIHEIDVLSGAFMLLRKKAMDEVGLLDESFFMYGEDIDLSYRIQKGGYKNYYFPETRIIHYKGESTKKSSVNYVFVFYKAMIIFAKKHFSGNNARFISLIIHLAIYLRASIAIFQRFTKSMLVPFLDFAISYLCIFFLSRFYGEHIIYKGAGGYAKLFEFVILPAYIITWQIFSFFSGGYDKPISLFRIFRGIVAGSGFILIIYSLLPEHYRFSRALILLGTISTSISTILIRIFLHFLKLHGYRLSEQITKRVAIIGSVQECERVQELLSKTSIKLHVEGCIYTEASDVSSEKSLGNIKQLEEIIQVHQLQEVIFCAKDLSAQSIIAWMLQLDRDKIDFKIAPPESLSIIGSNSIDTAGDLYVIDLNSILKPHNIRKKRVFDLAIALMVSCFSPILWLFQHHKACFFSNIFWVLIGKYSWIGYGHRKEKKQELPKIKPSVIDIGETLPDPHSTAEHKNQLRMVYAKNYLLENDIKVFFHHWQDLGNKPCGK